MPGIDFEQLSSITWETLINPLIMAIFAAMFMQLLGKDFIEILREFIVKKILKKELSEDWYRRDFVINFSTFVFCIIIYAIFAFSGMISFGNMFVFSLIAMAFSIVYYELVKNLLKRPATE
jgi:hypothetical protein